MRDNPFSVSKSDFHPKANELFTNNVVSEFLFSQFGNDPSAVAIVPLYHDLIFSITFRLGT